MNPTQSPWLRSFGLRGRLVILILLVFGSVSALFAYRLIETRNGAISAASVELLASARLVATESGDLIGHARSLMAVLSTLSDIRGLRNPECSAILARLLKQDARYAFIGVVDADAMVSCSAVPQTKPVSVQDRAWFKRVAEMRDFVVGGYAIGRSSGKRSVHLAYPLLSDSGEFSGAINVALDLDGLNRRLSELALPPSRTLAILDPDGTVLAARGWLGGSTGRSTSEQFIKAVKQQREGVTEISLTDNNAHLVAFTPLGGLNQASLIVAMGTSRDDLLGDADKAFVQNLLALLALTATMFAATWYGIRVWVLQPVRVMVGAAQQVSAGDLSTRIGPGYPSAELGQVARAFDNMTQSLATQVEMMRRVEDEVRMLNENLEQRIAERTAELRQFRHTLDQALDCIFMFRPDTLEFTYVNKGATLHIGYSEAELLQMKAFEITQEFTDAHFRELTQPLMDGRQQSVRFESVHRHKDGHDIPVEIFLQYVDGEEREPMFLSVVRDITERKLAIAEIQKLTTRLQLANEATGIGVWDWDVVTNDLVWDAGMYKLYGSEPGQFGEVYESWLAGVHPEDAGLTHDAIQAALSGNAPYDIEFRVVRPTGDLRWVNAIGAVQRDSSGKALRMIGTNLDITDRKQVEEALIAARDAAQLANRAKDSFLATTSHEIRTPLGGLMGMLEVLSLTSLNEEQRETLLLARDSGRSLLRILDDLLDWSKIEAGKLELAPRPTSIARLMSEVVNTYSRLASAKSLVLTQEVDVGLSPTLIVDPLRLSQVLNNFVSNALKFTPKGEVVVQAKLLGRGDSAERVRFSVTDSGIGIDKEVLPRLFQKYGQGSAETARMYGGTGLGLAICRRLADLLGGRIETQSAPGEGSTFSITLSLPVSTEVVDEKLVRASSDSAAVVPFLLDPDAQAVAPPVLVVDDHPTNRRLLALQLGLLGLRAETAEDGAVALSMWRDGRFAGVITDCHMPKMDGYALAQEIRRIEATEARTRTPIIGWSANALAEEEAICVAAGMDQLLVKPAELVDLRAALSKWPAVTASTPQALGPRDAGHDGPGGTAAAPIDLAALDKIAAIAADRAGILSDFMAQTRADLAELASAGDDLAACERFAHRMIGACRMVGAGELEAVCEAMQGAARQGNPENAHAAHEALSRAMARLEAYLASELEVVNK